MVVTAHKREQSIQDVPIAMTPVGGEATCEGFELDGAIRLAEIPVGGPGKAEVSIYGRNLTDFDDRTPSIDCGGFVNANWPTPRTWGMALSYRW